MVLAQLCGSISRALQQMSNATIIDEKVLDECLNEISHALVQSDVQIKLVRDMQTNIKNTVNLADAHSKRRIIHQALFNELCSILDPGKPSFTPKKGKASVVMFVGLKGSGKTTTCTKYAFYHQRKGWKPALVCADTFRAGAFDHLKQNATIAKIPFYGSYMESDPVKIAVEGVERFRKENCDLIIVDTSGRNKQEAAFFEEMCQVSEATKPDLVIFVIDSSIGQAAFDQAQAFKQSAAVGAVIITKMDGHAKGGGALSAVAATKSPVIFIGTGEHMDEFEVFDVKPFVNRLLGMGDSSGFVDQIHEVVTMDQQPELPQMLSEGHFTLRVMNEQFQKILKMDPIGQEFSMLPGFSSIVMRKAQLYMTMMDSMTNEELDSSEPQLMSVSQMIQIAQDSGRQVREVLEMMEVYKGMAKIRSKVKEHKTLAELGGSISRALQQMSNATIIDENVLDECLNKITSALVQSDVQYKLIRDMLTNIKNIVNLADGHNKRSIIHQAVFNELCNILDPGKPSFTLKKGKASVVMVVGLQGSGKTTTCTKYAFYHQRKGWRPALVCADTFRAGAFDQLKQNATTAKVPFYGSYMESDPVKIAVEGVERFKKENCDLIIVDTSGGHKQEAAFFEEMRQLSEATKPDLVIMVLDSTIGQAAFDQAQAFKQSAAVGAVIITKMDGHAKGGGALSAVAATKSPVIFLGTGEHMDEFEAYNVKPFVSRLLGMGDSSWFMDHIHEVVPMDQQPELPQMLSEGHFTLRIMYEQFQNIHKMDYIGQVFSKLPGSSSELMAKWQLYMTIMDSMTNEELDSSEPQLYMTGFRMMQIAQDSGQEVREVREMMKVYKGMAKIRSKVKELKTQSLMKQMGSSSIDS
ncbi:uncharacterized protein LOC131651801 isoform X1 [Vicia villosa]|uniref:uncharacterized protein LOC131651801 isoform X1 n=1 Tax=Vicia villosa TaxID=3911 RepID=UPI00273AF455|nr:uncharacterized protein LOC131651801 isoform X1 [Vicia villosa]